MLDAGLEFVATGFAALKAQLIYVLAYPFLPSQRIFWLYLFTSIVLAFCIYHIRTRKETGEAATPRGFLRFLFPREVWSNPSAWLDIRYFFFNQIIGKLMYVGLIVATLNAVFQLVTGGPNLIAASTQGHESDVKSILISTLYMFVVIGAVDFVAYTIHYFQHKVPFLWEFHKVHHSLEVMHPLSNYREHPVDNFVYAIGTGAAYGLVMGLTTLLFGYLPNMPELLGVPLLLFGFNIIGYNLRHSHVWLRWPGKWSMVFPSPAHHHIHHSCHPDHIDKNFAFVFPMWDVLFRTYHLPETNKDVRFGISEDYETEFTSCIGMYVVPFKNAYRLVKRNLHKKAEASGIGESGSRAP